MYFNSFEQDTLLEGGDIPLSPASLSIVDDVPIGGGKKFFLLENSFPKVALSQYLFTKYFFGDTLLSGYYTIECWAKGNGNISLYYETTSSMNNYRKISFSNNEWEFYSSDSLSFPQDKRLRIVLHSDAMNLSAQFDLIKVTQVR